MSSSDRSSSKLASGGDTTEVSNAPLVALEVDVAFGLTAKERPLLLPNVTTGCRSPGTIHQALEEIISQRMARKPMLYIHIITVTEHPNTQNGQPSWKTASVYDSGLLRITASYPGWLCRTTPDYFRTTSNYVRLLPVYSSQLGRTQGFSVPALRASLGLGETTYSPVPVQFTDRYTCAWQLCWGLS